MSSPPPESISAPAVSEGEKIRSRFSTLRRLFRRRRLTPIALCFVVLIGLGVAALPRVRPQLRAWNHLRAARTEVEHYHTAQAIRHLRICREVWPRDPEVLLLSARAARRAGVYSDTQRLLATYLEVKGRDDAYAFELLLLAAESQQDLVVDQCWQYVEEGRHDAGLLLEAVTRGYLQQYRLGLARRCLDRWRQLQPESPQMFYLEGLFNLDYAHAQTAAVESYSRAVELDPDHEEARLGLAVALLANREYAKAAEHFERLIQSQPDNGRILVGLAECRDGLGDSGEAVRLVEDVLARQPGMPAALSLRGRLAFKDGQLPEAENWLRQALSRNPMDHNACHTLYLCLQQSSRKELAEEQQKILRQMEQDSARFNEIVTKDIAQRPTDPALHCTLGEILLRSGRREAGIHWLESALKLDPTYAPARQAMTSALKAGMAQSQQGPPP